MPINIRFSASMLTNYSDCSSCEVRVTSGSCPIDQMFFWLDDDYHLCQDCFKAYAHEVHLKDEAEAEELN